ncbi:MAG: hypothetical protein GY928_11750 [Colwellia sp.]|nr:hypothetical protein [Colwellia sp.]
MENIIKIFVKVKHWQLFVVLCGLMFIPSFFIFDSPIPLLYEVLMIMFMFVFSCWLYAVSKECNKRTSVELQKSPIYMLIGLIYFTIFTIVSSMLLFSVQDSTQPQNISLIIPLIIPFYLLAAACIFYSFGFTAKRLVTLQRGERVGFFDYSGLFFMFWFFPFGIWFIQPKVNSLLGNENA